MPNIKYKKKLPHKVEMEQRRERQVQREGSKPSTNGAYCGEKLRELRQRNGHSKWPK